MPQQSKFFRVATEGATSDGRTISRDWISQMAKNFDPAKYGARVWLEHFRGISPDGLFKSYGDVTALQAREVEGGKLALFAQIQPLPDLVNMVNNAKQKIYTSIEVDPKFADTGEAYLVGLAVTDSPASLGTDVLAFAAQKRNHVFSQGEETSIEFSAEMDEKTFNERVRDIVRRFAFGKTDHASASASASDARFSALLGGMEEMGKALTDFSRTVQSRLDAAEKAQADLRTQLSKQEAAFADLRKQLESETPGHYTQRPSATGAGAGQLTDC